MKKLIPIPIDLVNEYLRYERDEGKLYWKKKSASNTEYGDEFGCINAKRYRVGRLCNVQLLTHRIIFHLEHRYCPKIVDHIDWDTLNNHHSNLRELSDTESQRHRGTPSTNTSGTTGVSPHGKKWRAQIGVESKSIHLGYFIDIQDAIDARKEAEIKYGYDKLKR